MGWPRVAPAVVGPALAQFYIGTSLGDATKMVQGDMWACHFEAALFGTREATQLAPSVRALENPAACTHRRVKRLRSKLDSSKGTRMLLKMDAKDSLKNMPKWPCVLVEGTSLSHVLSPLKYGFPKEYQVQELRYPLTLSRWF